MKAIKINSYQKRILSFALPVVLAEVGIHLQWIISDLFVAKLGSASLAAVGLTGNILFCTFLLSVGIFSVVSNLLGQNKDNNKEQCANIINSALVVAFFIGIITWIALYFLSLHLDILGQDQEVTILLHEYISIIKYGIFFQLFFLAISSIMEGLFYPEASLKFILMGLIIQILFSIILVNGNFGFPAWGIKGAAYSILFSDFIMAMSSIIYFYRSKIFMPFRGIFKFPTIKDLQLVLKIGIPVGGLFFFETTAYMIVNIFTGNISVSSSAGHQVLTVITDTATIIVYGLGTACAILIGEAYGAKDFLAIKDLSRNFLKLTVFIQITFISIILLIARKITHWFSLDIATSQLVMDLIPLMLVFQFINAIYFCFISLLCGINDTFIPSIQSLFSYWFVMIVSCYILTFTWQLKMQGIWLGMIGGICVATFLIGPRFYKKIVRGHI